MSAPAMIIRRENTMQRALPGDDDVIQTLATNGANEPSTHGLLPRRSRRGKVRLWSKFLRQTKFECPIGEPISWLISSS